MTIPETVLVFVGIPAGIILLITFAVYGRSMLRQPNRYRPGRAWIYKSAWFVPHPDAVVSAVHNDRPGAGTSTTAVGGASGEW